MQFNILSKDNSKSKQRADYENVKQPVNVLFQEIHFV